MTLTGKKGHLGYSPVPTNWMLMGIITLAGFNPCLSSMMSLNVFHGEVFWKEKKSVQSKPSLGLFAWIPRSLV